VTPHHANGTRPDGKNNRPRTALLILALLVVVMLIAVEVRHVTTRSAPSAAQHDALASHPTLSPRVSPDTHNTQHTTHTRRPVTAADVFAGVRIGIDPGHNGGNFTHPTFIDRRIWNGREQEACNTTGTATDDGYTEAKYNFAVATYLRSDLEQRGARVIMTRYTNSGVGPCVNRRARILDRAHVAVAIDIHADGGPPSGRGFAILEPVRDGLNNAVVESSHRYGADLQREFLRTGMPTSTYDGTNGINLRDDLAGLNLTTVPEVLIECGNMRNTTDAKMLISSRFQRRAAQAIMAAMADFLRSRPG